MVKFAATFILENPPLENGSPIPPGWVRVFFPEKHPARKMRPTAISGGAHDVHTLPRRRIAAPVAFQEPSNRDEITRKNRIADIFSRRQGGAG